LGDIGYWLDDAQIKNVIVISGAGVSVSAGIPDFRSPGTGLYDNLEAYNLPFPEAVFDLNFFKSNPKPFCSLAKEIWPGTRYCPTITHAFIKLLEDKGILLRNYTQNIDGMEVMTGVDPSKVIECHGHFRSAKCVDCKLPYPADKCREFMCRGEVPICPHCAKPESAVKAVSDEGVDFPTSPPSGYVKPDIVFFGESLPPIVRESIQSDLEKCDLLFVMGTSLTVYPVALLPLLIDQCTPRVLLNRELVGDFCGRRISNDDGDENECLENSSKLREAKDIWVEGDTDDSVRQLCRLAGWESELEKIHNGVRKKYAYMDAKRIPSDIANIGVESDYDIPALLEDDDLSNSFAGSTPNLSDEEDCCDLVPLPLAKKRRVTESFMEESTQKVDLLDNVDFDQV